MDMTGSPLTRLLIIIVFLAPFGLTGCFEAFLPSDVRKDVDDHRAHSDLYSTNVIPQAFDEAEVTRDLPPRDRQVLAAMTRQALTVDSGRVMSWEGEAAHGSIEAGSEFSDNGVVCQNVNYAIKRSDERNDVQATACWDGSTWAFEMP